MKTIIELGHYYLSEQISKDVLFSIVYGLKLYNLTQEADKMFFIDDIHGEKHSDGDLNVYVLTNMIAPTVVMYESETIPMATKIFEYLGEKEHINGNRIRIGDSFTCVAMDVALCFMKSELGYKNQIIVLENIFEQQQKTLHEILQALFDRGKDMDFSVRTIITNNGQIQSEYLFGKPIS